MEEDAMKRSTALFSFIILFLLAALAVLAAQEEASALAIPLGDEYALRDMVGRSLRIRTEGGGDFRGILFSVGLDRLEILDNEGRIVPIARSAVLSIAEEAKREGYFQDAAENRLIVLPTAFGMDKGEFHVTNTEIIAFTGSYGLGPHLTLWGGISIPGALVNVKASLPLGSFGALAAGAFGGYAWIGEALIGIPYGILSLGNPERHFDIAGGAAYFKAPDMAGSWSGIAALGGKLPVSRGTALVGEAWLIMDGGEEYDPGFRLSAWPAFVFRIATSRYSWDLGAVFPFSYGFGGSGWSFILGSDVFIPIPVVSFTYRIS